jgi:uncharacterized protein YodC (DUF2158 family)
MANVIKDGDLVELKSGGPTMTVEVAFDDGDVRCVWFAGEKQQTHIFRGSSLIKTETQNDTK